MSDLEADSKLKYLMMWLSSVDKKTVYKVMKELRDENLLTDQGIQVLEVLKNKI